MGEATTKAAILRDFIELLGWEIPTNTELEYAVKALGRTFNVDYALVLEGRPVAFLEAKGLDTSLTPTHREQLSEYLRSKDVNWGILTNGEEYEFYQRWVIDSKVSVEPVERTALQNLPQKSNIIEAYRAETIRKEESEVIIEHIRELRRSWEALNDEKTELATAVTNLLTDSVSDAIEAEAQSQAKEMIDRLLADLESEISPDRADLTNDPNPEPETGSSPTNESERYYVEIMENGDIEAEFENTVQSSLMASVVDHLLQNHDLISEVSPLPYVPGKTRAIIHNKPAYNGTEMAQPRELADGYFVELNLSWQQKKREMKRLADACGLEISINSPDTE
jgi:hypothetical protein